MSVHHLYLSYLAVCRPLVAAGLRTLRCVQRAVIVVLIAALLYNIPVFFENKVPPSGEQKLKIHLSGRRSLASS